MEIGYFEDYEIGQTLDFGTYTADKDEFMEMARRWDPQVFHTDEEAARGSIYGGLVAPHIYTMAIANWLGNNAEPDMAAVAMLGYDNMRFPNPVRHGDRLTMKSELIEKKESRTKADRGVAVFRGVMTNQHGEPVLTMDATIMMMRRPG